VCVFPLYHGEPVKTYHIANTSLDVSRIGCGTMFLGGPWEQSLAPLTAIERARAANFLENALERGVTLFDHADIYDRGKSETVFGEVLREMPGVRDKIIIQSKCGIRFKNEPNQGDPARYDFSYSYIVGAVEASLRRLQVDQLDILLLHRPDPLVEPEEVAQAFTELEDAGKVRFFGVSNHTQAQIELLKRFVAQPLVVNQLELNLLHCGMIREGILANQDTARYTAADGILDYCRVHDIFIQAWSPLAGGLLVEPIGSADVRETAAADAVAEMAEARGTSRHAIALAWILRHPAHVQPIVGTTNVDRLRACCQADELNMSREEWYVLLKAARGASVP
jgi:predicted oxidoreductase